MTMKEVKGNCGAGSHFAKRFPLIHWAFSRVPRFTPPWTLNSNACFIFQYCFSSVLRGFHLESNQSQIIFPTKTSHGKTKPSLNPEK